MKETENNFKYRKGNIELHSCNKHLLQSGEHTTAEIIQHINEENNITISYWVRGKEGYNLSFVSDRPFNTSINIKDFHILAKIGQEILDYEFNNAENNEE